MEEEEKGRKRIGGRRGMMEAKDVWEKCRHKRWEKKQESTHHSLQHLKERPLSELETLETSETHLRLHFEVGRGEKREGEEKGEGERRNKR